MGGKPQAAGRPYMIWGHTLKKATPPTSTTPGETRQGGVKRSGTEEPRSHQLLLNGNFTTEERETPTHIKGFRRALSKGIEREEGILALT